jgi:hypothetical protein
LDLNLTPSVIIIHDRTTKRILHANLFVQFPIVDTGHGFDARFLFWVKNHLPSRNLKHCSSSICLSGNSTTHCLLDLTSISLVFLSMTYFSVSLLLTPWSAGMLLGAHEWCILRSSGISSSILVCSFSSRRTSPSTRIPLFSLLS